MANFLLQHGTPDEPDTGDWDAICSTPSISGFFEMLFHEIAGCTLPGEIVTSEEEDSIRQIRQGWRGDRKLGVEIRVVSPVETSDLPVYCSWETHGLPGMKIKWDYKLDYAGQLGHVAFRHVRLEGDFDSAAGQQRFAVVWKKNGQRGGVYSNPGEAGRKRALGAFASARDPIE
ncbi:MAG TPA: hypothetical protein VFK06_21075 [Candidatus Angelobacter sp.]|nr:hypothetical protein [Candidatus Angelobacter sp.]